MFDNARSKYVRIHKERMNFFFLPESVMYPCTSLVFKTFQTLPKSYKKVTIKTLGKHKEILYDFFVYLSIRWFFTFTFTKFKLQCQKYFFCDNALNVNFP